MLSSFVSSDVDLSIIEIYELSVFVMLVEQMGSSSLGADPVSTFRLFIFSLSSLSFSSMFFLS